MEFNYDTRYIQRLREKFLSIEVFDKDLVGRDDFIGSCKIDLHTIASGPVHHEIELRDNHKSGGRVVLDVIFAQISDISITLKEIQASFDIDIKQAVLKYQLLNTKGPECKTKICENTKTPSWNEFEQLVFNAPLKEFVMESIVLKITDPKKGTDHSFAEVPLLEFYEFQNKLKPFKTVLKSTATSQQIGTIEGFLFLSEVPEFAQMVKGTHTETGITNGEKLMECLVAPDLYVASPGKPTTLSNAPSTASLGKTSGIQAASSYVPTTAPFIEQRQETPPPVQQPSYPPQQEQPPVQSYPPQPIQQQYPPQAIPQPQSQYPPSVSPSYPATLPYNANPYPGQSTSPPPQQYPPQSVSPSQYQTLPYPQQQQQQTPQYPPQGRPAYPPPSTSPYQQNMLPYPQQSQDLRSSNSNLSGNSNYSPPQPQYPPMNTQQQGMPQQYSPQGMQQPYTPPPQGMPSPQAYPQQYNSPQQQYSPQGMPGSQMAHPTMQHSPQTNYVANSGQMPPYNLPQQQQPYQQYPMSNTPPPYGQQGPPQGQQMGYQQGQQSGYNSQPQSNQGSFYGAVPYGQPPQGQQGNYAPPLGFVPPFPKPK